MNRNLPIAVACLLTVAVSSAHAQSPTFSAVFTQVQPGETLTLTHTTGQQLTGKLVDGSATSLKLSINGATREFLGTDVRKVVRRDSAKNGALIGLAVGAVPGIVLGGLFMTYCENEASSCPSAPLILGAMTGLGGMLAGYEIDRHINRVLFESPKRTAAVRVAPLLARDRKGVAVSLTF